MELKVRKFGNSLGVVLPKEVVSRLNTGDGKILHLSEVAGEGYRISPYDEEFQKKVAAAEDIMARFSDALHVLAK
ncbi:putative transcriptional regulator, AbrB family [Acetobacteraceae bacterium EV16G]